VGWFHNCLQYNRYGSSPSVLPPDFLDLTFYNENMIVSFAQTYGDGRSKLYEIYSRDQRLIEFKNLLDLNLYSFHNCSPDAIKYFFKMNKVEKSEYLRFGDVTYPSIIGLLKKKLKELGCTHFFFSQDDTFSWDNENIDFIELLEYVKGFKEKFMLSLSYTNKDIKFSEDPKDVGKSFNVYHSNSFDFLKSQNWSMDDTPFICTMDILEEVYDEIYVNSFEKIWECEPYLASKYARNFLPRYVLGTGIFSNYNIIGPTNKNRELFLEKLKQKNLL
jgi:hypothetical protein